jgi:hypothetical protein
MALFYAPEKNYIGGTELALDKRRDQFEAGRQLGIGYMPGQGSGGGAGLSNALTGETQRYAQSLLPQARATMEGGAIGLGDASRAMTAAANTNTSSVAEAQQRAMLDQNARQMQAQASAARGGNQAAAMRNAQAIGATNVLQAAPQIAALRAQEEQARVARQMAAAQFGGQLAQQRVSLGQQQQAVGLQAQLQAQGVEQQNAAIQNQFALGLGQLGLGQQSLYTNAGLTQEQMQLQAQLAYEQAKAQQSQQAVAFAGGVLGMAGDAMGGMAGAA